MSEDPYAILELAPDASLRELKRAYKRKLKLHRPDRDPEGFQRIRGAFEQLREQLEWRESMGLTDEAPQTEAPPPEVLSFKASDNAEEGPDSDQVVPVAMEAEASHDLSHDLSHILHLLHEDPEWDPDGESQEEESDPLLSELWDRAVAGDHEGALDQASVALDDDPSHTALHLFRLLVAERTQPEALEDIALQALAQARDTEAITQQLQAIANDENLSFHDPRWQPHLSRHLALYESYLEALHQACLAGSLSHDEFLSQLHEAGPSFLRQDKDQWHNLLLGLLSESLLGHPALAAALLAEAQKLPTDWKDEWLLERQEGLQHWTEVAQELALMDDAPAALVAVLEHQLNHGFASAEVMDALRRESTRDPKALSRWLKGLHKRAPTTFDLLWVLGYQHRLDRQAASIDDCDDPDHRELLKERKEMLHHRVLFFEQELESSTFNSLLGYLLLASIGLAVYAAFETSGWTLFFWILSEIAVVVLFLFVGMSLEYRWVVSHKLRELLLQAEAPVDDLLRMLEDDPETFDDLNAHSSDIAEDLSLALLSFDFPSFLDPPQEQWLEDFDDPEE